MIQCLFLLYFIFLNKTSNSCRSKYRTVFFFSKQRLFSLWAVWGLFLQMSPTERVIVRRALGKNGKDFFFIIISETKCRGCEKVWPRVSAVISDTQPPPGWTSLVANEIAAVLVNCKSRRNEFSSITLWRNQPCEINLWKPTPDIGSAGFSPRPVPSFLRFPIWMQVWSCVPPI